MRIALLFLLCLITLASCGDEASETTDPADDDLDGPIPRPDSGYGADGEFSMETLSFTSPLYANKLVEIFYPAGRSEPVPTLFYCHPYGGEQSEYTIGLFRFLTSIGYAVVFAPYPTTDATVEERYDILWASFREAATAYPDLLDLTRVGFVGHSFGGGAAFTMAYRGFVEEGWGAEGRFIFAMAQWYTYELTQEQLQSFPANTRLITQVYEDDIVNDHRMAIDIFNNINIPTSEKDFVLITESALPGYTYTAGHDLPNTRTAYDAYDYYGIYRLLHALIDYSFYGSAEAKKVALGNGSAEQITMPAYDEQPLETLVVTDEPVPAFAEDHYQFSCSAIVNPRKEHCE